MLREKLKNHQIILASGSPRRQQFFKDLDLDFTINIKSVDEVYPNHLKAHEISNYLAELKASVFLNDLQPNDILITSDTVVWHNNVSLAKPADANEAYQMLQTMSNDWHNVITSVSFTTTKQQKTLFSTTKVKFKTLNDSEIWYYIDNYKPYDKAGAYGIQEWIGLIGIEEIKGSYANVVGLPTHLVYKTLTDIVN